MPKRCAECKCRMWPWKPAVEIEVKVGTASSTIRYCEACGDKVSRGLIDIASHMCSPEPRETTESPSH